MLICKYRTKQAIIGDAPSKAYLLEFGIVRPRKAEEEQSEFCAIFFFLEKNFRKEIVSFLQLS